MFAHHELRSRDYSARTSMAPHTHDVESLSILVRGAFTERIQRSERNYVRGHVAFLPAGVLHSQMFGSAGARQVTFRPQPDWIEYLSDCKTPLAASPYIIAPIFHQLGERLLEEMTRDDRYSRLSCEGLMLEIVAAFGRRNGPVPRSRKPPRWLFAVRDYVQEHALAPIALKEVACAVGRHEIHVAREFRRFFGASVGEFTRRLRTEEAAHLLLESRMSISEIALNCGFSTHSHLCREFKGRFGVTPSGYREISRR